MVAADSVEYWTASFDEFSVLRVWMSAIGYSLRPAIICVVIAVVCESILKYEGMINTTGAVTIVFYYLYINTQQFKRDALTGVMKRRYFYLDGEKKERFQDKQQVIAKIDTLLCDGGYFVYPLIRIRVNTLIWELEKSRFIRIH